MKFVFACRVVTYDQICRRLFPNIEPRVARRRIRNLADHGYFKLGVIELLGKAVRTVQPLPAIWPLIKEKFPFEIDHPHFKSESLEHDVRMAEVFMRIESLKCYRSFFTENLLQSSSSLANDPRLQDIARLQSDGVLTVQDPSGNLKLYAIEFEFSKKAPKLYREKFVDYYLARGIDGVLYISPEREISNLISRTDAEICRDRDSIVYFSFEESVLSFNDNITFSNHQGLQLDFT
jgi:hypothetical protein